MSSSAKVHNGDDNKGNSQGTENSHQSVRLDIEKGYAAELTESVPFTKNPTIISPRKIAMNEVKDVTDQIKSNGAQLIEDIKRLAQENPVFLISKHNCPYCIELKRSLDSYGISYTKFESNKLTSTTTSDLKKACDELYHYKSFPMLIVDGEFKGGCSDFKTFENAHNLSFIDKYITHTPSLSHHYESTRVKTSAVLFWFPDSINNNAARATGGIATVICILCIAFYNYVATPWVVLCLAIDFLLRFLWGGAPSLIGVLSMLAVTPFEPVYRSGAQKQFAAFCGLFLSTWSAGFFLSGYDAAGAVILAMLMAATFLEFSIDFCLGCFIFGMGVSLGIIPPNVYRASINLIDDKRFAWKYTNADPNVYPKAVNQHVLLAGQTEPTDIDLIRKDRWETEYKNKDIDVIRHIKIDYFGIPMSLAALAYVFNLLVVTVYPFGFGCGNSCRRARDAIGCSSAIIFVALGIIYLLKLMLYSKKVYKEWMHPITTNMFSTVTISLSLYALLMYEADTAYAVTLAWIGAGFQMFFSVLIVSRMVFEPTSNEWINPSILMAPVGNFVSAIALGIYPTYVTPMSNYTYIARLWFAVAMLFAIVLFTITLQKSFADVHADNRLRLTIFIWQAAAGVAGPAYLITNGFDAFPAVGHGLVFQCLTLITVFFFAVNVMGYLKGFYAYVNDMSIWIASFSSSTLAITTIFYYQFVGSAFVLVCVWITISIACYITATCTVYTLIWNTDFSLFKPKQKWSPLSFMKLTHEAFRIAIPRIGLLIANMNIEKPFSVVLLVEELQAFLVAYHAHARQEDKILFPVARGLFPGLNPSMSEEHETEHAIVQRIETALNTLAAATESGSSAVAGAISTLQAEFPFFGEHLLNHMRNEESTVTVVMRKYLSLDRQKEVTKEAYQLVTADEWHVIIPYILSSLPHPVWKTRFLRTFIWAMPDRAQEIGLMVYRGVDSVTFAFLADDIPEMIPRGVYNHHRKY